MDATLALLEQAPDRQTAEMMLVAAMHAGVGADRLRASWQRWEHNQDEAHRRGEGIHR